jgi:restriction endonuclease S subunit
MAKFEFQIPSSLDRQKEIADALDRFELSLSSLISALEATKARYEYYRDLMLNF